MEKRVVVFLILSLAIIIGYDYVMKELGILPSPPSTQEETNPVEKASSDSLSGTSLPQQASPETTLAPVSSSRKQSAGSGTINGSASDERTVVVDTDLFRAILTNRGAVLKSWELKRYTTNTPSGSQPVQLMYEAGKFERPLTLHVQDKQTAKMLDEALYHVERDFETLDGGHPTGHLTLRYRDPARSLSVEKQLTFHYQSYVVDVTLKTEGISGPLDIGLGTNFGIVEWGEGFIGLIGPASLVDGKVEKDTPSTETERKGQVQWVALQDKYFISVLIPSQATAVLVRKEADKVVSAGVRLSEQAPGAAATVQLYAGPKEFDTLKALSVGLEDTIDFGWFIYGSWSLVKMVAKPIFYVLRFLYEFTHNYGVTIILLTVGIKLLFVPLQYKSYKSMKQMQVIQPKVAALQTKHKEDRDRLNKELMKLYRDHKVNPVGGCLPMLLQMPVFVALFNILYMTIDLRQAPFMLWINDLSVQDPYYVLPLIMGATMVIQQKITPTTMDPTQAKIMLMLPAMMTFLFITFPAGLVLYWLTNNVLTIGQQLATDRFIFRRRPLPVPSDRDEEMGNRGESRAADKRKKDLPNQ